MLVWKFKQIASHPAMQWWYDYHAAGVRCASQIYLPEEWKQITNIPTGPSYEPRNRLYWYYEER